MDTISNLILTLTDSWHKFCASCTYCFNVVDRYRLAEVRDSQRRWRPTSVSLLHMPRVVRQPSCHKVSELKCWHSWRKQQTKIDNWCWITSRLARVSSRKSCRIYFVSQLKILTETDLYKMRLKRNLLCIWFTLRFL